MYYCQDDGGQWNVKVNVHERIKMGGEVMFAVIFGKDLKSMHTDDVGYGWLLVNIETLFDTKQP